MILRKLASIRFSEVSPEWEGKTAVVIATGPSLTRDQVETVRVLHLDGAVKCIAVNDAYLWADFADVQYSADSRWHEWHTKGIEKAALGLSAADVAQRWATFKGQKCSIQSSGANIKDEAVHILRNRDHPFHGNGLSSNPQILVTGRNSGFQALNLAILAGAAKVILLGYDGRADKHTGRTHFFGEHPKATSPDAFPEFRRAFNDAEAAINQVGVKVINCSPNSYIDTFPKMELEDALV